MSWLSVAKEIQSLTASASTVLAIWRAGFERV